MLISIGLFLLAGGLAAIGFAWNGVDGKTSVADQVPFVIAGGLGGLAIVVAGVVLIDVSVRLHDARASREQIVQLTESLTEVRQLLEAELDDGPGAGQDAEGRRDEGGE